MGKPQKPPEVKKGEEKKPEEEPKIKMYRLSVNFEFEAPSIEEARQRARKEVVLFGQVKDKERVEDAVTRVVRRKYSSRADRLSEAESLVDQAKSIVEELKGEIEEWHGNLPENFQNGDKGSALQECISALEEVEQQLESADFSSVEFPGMY